MHRQLILFSILILYYAIGIYGLYVFDAGIIVSALILFGVPSLILSRLTLAPPVVLISIALLGGGVAVLFEGIAHIYGLWYTFGIIDARLFGLVSIEMIIAIVMQVIFLALLYEIFFDDGIYTQTSAWKRMSFFGVFFVGVIGLIGIHYLLLDGLFINYSYFWIIGIVLASALAALAMHRNLDVAFFDKIIDFTLVSSIFMGMFLWVSSANSHQLFLNNEEYLYVFYFYGQMVPIEEIMLLFALPFFIGTMYELYLDDAA